MPWGYIWCSSSFTHQRRPLTRVGQQPSWSFLPQLSCGPNIQLGCLGCRNQNSILRQCKLVSPEMPSPEMPSPASMEVTGLKMLPTWFPSAQHRSCLRGEGAAFQAQKHPGKAAFPEKSEREWPGIKQVCWGNAEGRVIQAIHGNCPSQRGTALTSLRLWILLSASGYQKEHVHAHTHSHTRLYSSFNLWLAKK